ncbi:MAG: bifunctional 2-polyprenyl-6-hydroxyphenol methylase/3-demethylubiquinol 3-O-methyltransferase UbiG [Pseudomonadota bacterium]
MHGYFEKKQATGGGPDKQSFPHVRVADKGGPRHRAIALFYGLLCHSIFALGVGSMVFGMYFGLQTGWGTVDYPFALIVNALLIAQFPIAHSILLTKPGKRFLNNLAPSGLATTLQSTTYATIAGLQLALLFQLWTPTEIIWWQATGLSLYLMIALYALSWAFLGLALLNSGLQLQSGALGWFSLFRGVKPRYPDMPTHGLYRILRHPIYLAFAFTLWTPPTWTPDQFALACAWTLYCVLAPIFKERRFLTRHGRRYETYRKDVPYMIPNFSGTKTKRNLNIYDDVADQWWSDDVTWIRTLHNMVDGRLRSFDKIADWQNAKVLDLGCAGGFMAEALAKRGAHVTGIDPAHKAIEAAKDHAKQSDLKLRYDVGVGETLPYDDKSFDYVVCVDVLEHVNDLDAVLDEVKRVLKPGGVFFFDTISKSTLARIAVVTVAEDILGLLPQGTHDPALFISPKTLRGALENRGFQVSRFEGLGPRGMDKSFTPTFGRVPTTSIIYMGYAVKEAA